MVPPLEDEEGTVSARPVLVTVSIASDAPLNVDGSQLPIADLQRIDFGSLTADN
jgi:hypothetical protein